MYFTNGRAVHVLGVLVTLLYLTFSQSLYAQDHDSIELGGKGGKAFVERCSPGEYLVGLSGRSGNWVDAIAPVCAKWDEELRSFGPSAKGAQHGGKGGEPRAFECDNRSAIVSIIGEEAENEFKSVGLIVPSCGLAENPSKITPPLTGRRFGTSFTEHLPSEPGVGTTAQGYYDSANLPHCGKNEVAVGIFGSAGNTLDRVGLICSAKPFVKPSSVTRKSTGAVPAPFRDDCKPGFYFRLAGPDDHVCVTFESRAQTAYENSHASERVDPRGAYGPKSCLSGFVWRDAFKGDLVCVTPERRTAVIKENALAESRKKSSK